MYSNIARMLLVYSCCWLSCPAILAAETIVRVGGSGTGSGMVRVLATQFEKEHPDIKVQVMSSLGSSGGLKALNSGALDIALSARPLKEEEKKEGAKVVFSSRTPFVFMVNKNVALANITGKELVALYNGTQLKWPNGSQVRLVLRPAGDINTKLLQAISPELNGAVQMALQRPDMLNALTDQESDELVVRTSGAIGATTLAQYQYDRLAGKLLSFNGVKPTLENLRSNRYPLAKQLLIVVIPGKTTPAMRQFVDFLKSARAKKILASGGIIPDEKQPAAW